MFNRLNSSAQATSQENNNEEGSSKEKTKLESLNLFKMSTACYLPAFLIVFLSFAFSMIENIFLNADQSNTVAASERIEAIIKEEIDETLNNRLASSGETLTQQESDADAFRSASAKEYIDDRIREEARVQAEKVLGTEINSLESDVKGDLLTQISLPVVFAVASIFAAFAVKDVIVEMLKDREKDRVKQEISRDLELHLVSDLLPNYVSLENNRIVTALKQIEAYTYWLEHKLLNAEIVKAIDDESNSSLLDQTEKDSNLIAIERLIDRSKMVMCEVSRNFESSKFQNLKKAEDIILEMKIKGADLNIQIQNRLLERLESTAQQPTEKSEKSVLTRESIYDRVDSIFEIQINLVIATLSKLKTGDDSESEEELDVAIESFKKALVRDVQERAERAERSRKFNAAIETIRTPYD